MERKMNCPNCGAPIRGAICEYCSTVFYDLANVEIGKKTFIRMKIGDAVHVFEAYPKNINIEGAEEETVFYADGEKYFVERNKKYDVEIRFRIVADDNGVLFATVKKK